MFKVRGAASARRLPLALLIIFAGLAAAAAATMVGCKSEEPENGLTLTTAAAPGTPEALPAPGILSLAPSDSPAADVHELVLSWKPIPGIDPPPGLITSAAFGILGVIPRGSSTP